MTYTAIIAIGDREYIRKSFYGDLGEARRWATSEIKSINGRWAQVVDRHNEIHFYIDSNGQPHDYSNASR